MINPRAKERICHDFYPNCTYCTCFSMCFPKNEIEDVSSQIFLEDNNWKLEEAQVLYKAASIRNH